MSLNIVNIHGDIEGDYDIIATLPQNATNGDVIKAMFPNESFFEDIFLEVMHYGNYQRIVSDWWNAPFKVEKEEK